MFKRWTLSLLFGLTLCIGLTISSNTVLAQACITQEHCGWNTGQHCVNGTCQACPSTDITTRELAANGVCGTCPPHAPYWRYDTVAGNWACRECSYPTYYIDSRFFKDGCLGHCAHVHGSYPFVGRYQCMIWNNNPSAGWGFETKGQSYGSRCAVGMYDPTPGAYSLCAMCPLTGTTKCETCSRYAPYYRQKASGEYFCSPCSGTSGTNAYCFGEGSCRADYMCCPPEKPYYEENIGRCHKCLESKHCGVGKTCVNFECVPTPVACTNHFDCGVGGDGRECVSGSCVTCDSTASNNKTIAKTCGTCPPHAPWWRYNTLWNVWGCWECSAAGHTDTRTWNYGARNYHCGYTHGNYGFSRYHQDFSASGDVTYGLHTGSRCAIGKYDPYPSYWSTCEMCPMSGTATCETCTWNRDPYNLLDTGSYSPYYRRKSNGEYFCSPCHSKSGSSNYCKNGLVCNEDYECACPPATPYWEANTNECRACLTSAHCTGGKKCVNFVCINNPTTCNNHFDCSVGGDGRHCVSGTCQACVSTDTAVKATAQSNVCGSCPPHAPYWRLINGVGTCVECPGSGSWTDTRSWDYGCRGQCSYQDNAANAYVRPFMCRVWNNNTDANYKFPTAQCAVGKKAVDPAKWSPCEVCELTGTTKCETCPADAPYYRRKSTGEFFCSPCNTKSGNNAYCTSPGSCNSDYMCACSVEQPYFDLETLECRGCLNSSQCAPGKSCVNFTCVNTPTTCTSHYDCSVGGDGKQCVSGSCVTCPSTDLNVMLTAEANLCGTCPPHAPWWRRDTENGTWACREHSWPTHIDTRAWNHGCVSYYGAYVDQGTYPFTRRYNCMVWNNHTSTGHNFYWGARCATGKYDPLPNQWSACKMCELTGTTKCETCPYYAPYYRRKSTGEYFCSPCYAKSGASQYCVSTLSCNGDYECGCPVDKPYFEPNAGECRGCLTSAHCTGGKKCVNFACITSPTNCSSHFDCGVGGEGRECVSGLCQNCNSTIINDRSVAKTCGTCPPDAPFWRNDTVDGTWACRECASPGHVDTRWWYQGGIDYYCGYVDNANIPFTRRFTTMTSPNHTNPTAHGAAGGLRCPVGKFARWPNNGIGNQHTWCEPCPMIGTTKCETCPTDAPYYRRDASTGEFFCSPCHSKSGQTDYCLGEGSCNGNYRCACPGAEPYFEEGTRECRGCLSSSHCAPGQRCVNFACVANPTTCISHYDCGIGGEGRHCVNGTCQNCPTTTGSCDRTIAANNTCGTCPPHAPYWGYNTIDQTTACREVFNQNAYCDTRWFREGGKSYASYIHASHPWAREYKIMQKNNVDTAGWGFVTKTTGDPSTWGSQCSEGMYDPDPNNWSLCKICPLYGTQKCETCSRYAPYYRRSTTGEYFCSPCHSKSGNSDYCHRENGETDQECREGYLCCPPEKPHFEENISRCHECLENKHCGAGKTCVNFTCVTTPTTCTNHFDCGVGGEGKECVSGSCVACNSTVTSDKNAAKTCGTCPPHAPFWRYNTLWNVWGCWEGSAAGHVDARNWDYGARMYHTGWTHGSYGFTRYHTGMSFKNYPPNNEHNFRGGERCPVGKYDPYPDKWSLCDICPMSGDVKCETCTWNREPYSLVDTGTWTPYYRRKRNGEYFCSPCHSTSGESDYCTKGLVCNEDYECGCPPEKPYWEANISECRACLTSANCSGSQKCVNFECVPNPTTCTSDWDCSVGGDGRHCVSGTCQNCYSTDTWDRTTAENNICRTCPLHAPFWRAGKCVECSAPGHWGDTRTWQYGSKSHCSHTPSGIYSFQRGYNGMLWYNNPTTGWRFVDGAKCAIGKFDVNKDYYSPCEICPMSGTEKCETCPTTDPYYRRKVTGEFFCSKCHSTSGHTLTCSIPYICGVSYVCRECEEGECVTGGDVPDLCDVDADCWPGFKCTGSPRYCAECTTASPCGSCNCGSSQRPDGMGACVNTNACCQGSCNLATGANACAYSDLACSGVQQCQTSGASAGTCCGSITPYWRNSACKPCETTSGHSGTCNTPGKMCNADFDCVSCTAADTGCIECYTNSHCSGIRQCSSSNLCCPSSLPYWSGSECVQCLEHRHCATNICQANECKDATTVQCDPNQVWHQGECKSCPLGATSTGGTTCVCPDEKVWNSFANTCVDKIERDGVATSSGGTINPTVPSSALTDEHSEERYNRIRSKINRIKDKLSQSED